jgi:hypothetical protein
MRSTLSPLEIYPGDDSPHSWHIHADQTWEWGATCDACRSPIFVPASRFAGIRFNTRHLKLQRELHQTVREQVAEIYEGARETGRDITRA